MGIKIDGAVISSDEEKKQVILNVKLFTFNMADLVSMNPPRVVEYEGKDRNVLSIDRDLTDYHDHLKLIFSN
jgi:hypothetical protein